MGKKRAVKSAESTGFEHIEADELLDDVTTQAAAKAGIDTDEGLVGKSVLCCLPVPSLAFRYLMQVEGLPLSRVYILTGEKKSFKSTFLAEMIRWFRVSGGFGTICEAETKPNTTLTYSVLRWDTKALKIVSCDTIEEWQAFNNFTVEQLQKKCEQAGGYGRRIPVCLCVDSLMGKASKRTVDKIQKVGYADVRYAIEAGAITDFLKVLPSSISGWPFVFVGVNHVKPRVDERTGMRVYHMPGGEALQYHSAMIIRCAKQRTVDKSDFTEITISMRTDINTYGRADVRIQVPLRLWMQNDAAEGEEPVVRLHTKFMWHAATTQLLFKGSGMTAATFSRLQPKIRDIIDIHEKRAGQRGLLYWSNTLGIPSSDPVPDEEFGLAIERNVGVLSELYRVLGVSRQPMFEPAVDYMSLVDEYKHVVQQADSAKVAAARAMSLGKHDG